MRLRWAALVLAAMPVEAGPFAGADVVFLGEIHDNPHHHAAQAALTAEIRPSALVFEMLTREQAALVSPDLVDDAHAMEDALGWADSGWPDFAFYHPIFAAAPEAATYGAAVPRDEARGITEDGLAAVFGDDAARFGLDAPLPEDEQAQREALQKAAHCDALPDDMLPMMVDMQRLRDARLAEMALRALADTGGPVVVITGNGHARTDWGAPALIATAAPEVTVHALGQGETGATLDGRFDDLREAPPVTRDDPCAAFR